MTPSLNKVVYKKVNDNNKIYFIKNMKILKIV